MRIEVLFPEICNLYGELENISYLKKSYPDIEVVQTALTEKPLFAEEEPALIYMGTMTERSQTIVIEVLRGYVDRIRELIDGGVHFLITGNALEVFGKRIHDVDGTEIQGLGLFDTTAERDMMNRYNSLYLGDFQDMKIVGFKSQFAHSWWGEDQKPQPLFLTERGPGLHPGIKEEGIRVNHFMATYLIGPLLVLNPPFAKYILKGCGVPDPRLAFEEEAMDAYDTRVKEYSDPGTGFYY